MIPPVIIQYWDQANKPYDIESLMATWVRNNRSFEYFEFDRESAKEFINFYYGEEVGELFENASFPAMRSDIFRLAYILERGGIYIDAGTRCLKSLSDLILLNDNLILMRKHHGRICNGFIAAEKQNKIIKAIWNRALANLKSKMNDDVWNTTGPGIYIDILSGSYNHDKCLIVPQEKIKNWFRIENQLLHKKKHHWSNLQQDLEIFANSKDGAFLEKVDGIVEREEIIFHLGPHKTGTTSLQSLIVDNIKQLEEKGIYVLSVRSDISVYYGEWRNKYTKVLHRYLLGLSSYTEAKGKLVDLFKQVIFDPYIHANKLLFSDENLLGPMPGHYFAGKNGREISFYKAHNLVFSSITEASNGIPLKICICRREFKSIVLSSYKDHVAKLETCEDFYNFLEVLSNNLNNEYLRFYKNIEDTFGNSLCVILFEEFVKSPDNVFEKILGFKPATTYSKKENESLSWRAVELAIRISPNLNSQSERINLRRFLKNEITGGGNSIEHQVDNFLRNKISTGRRGNLQKIDKQFKVITFYLKLLWRKVLNKNLHNSVS